MIYLVGNGVDVQWMRAGTATGAWGRRRPESHFCSEFSHIHHRKRVAEPYPIRGGAYSSSPGCAQRDQEIKANRSLNITSESVGNKGVLLVSAMVRQRTASTVLIRRSRPGVSQHPVPGPQGTMARPSVGMRMGAPRPMAIRVAERWQSGGGEVDHHRKAGCTAGST